jgi:hypothetical protein
MFVAGPKDCALGDERVRVSDFEFRWSGAGYGPVDPAADDAFVHRCDLSMSRPVDDVPHGRAAGEVVLTRYPAITTSPLCGRASQASDPRPTPRCRTTTWPR